MEANSTPAPASDRDPAGRFLRGHGVKSPGRPPRERERAYLTAVESECTLPQWRRIVARAVEDAIQGDRFARDWLSRYLLPEPSRLIELRVAEADTPLDALTDEELAEIALRIEGAGDAGDAGDNDD